MPSYRPSLKLVGAVLRLAEVPLPGVPQVSVDGNVDLGVRSRPGNISCEDLHRVQHNWAGTWTERQRDGQRGKKDGVTLGFGELEVQVSGPGLKEELVFSYYLLNSAWIHQREVSHMI